jgi:hypothetical protein
LGRVALQNIHFLIATGSNACNDTLIAKIAAFGHLGISEREDRQWHIDSFVGFIREDCYETIQIP